MRKPAWARLGSVSDSRLSDALHEAHWGAQLVAAAGQNFAEPAEDDSHRALTWDGKRRAFVGAAFAGSYPFRVGLRPDDLTLHLLDRTEDSLSVFALEGRPLDAGYEWLMKAVASYTGALPEIDRPEYEMPEHPIADGDAFSGAMDEELLEVGALFSTAADALLEVANRYEEADPVRCWPHHFDIATLVHLPADDNGKDRSIGIGMAPFGGGLSGWYWYVTPYPYPDESDLPEIDGPGGWHTEGWTGAVLTSTDVLKADPEFRLPLVRKFIDRAFAAAEKTLGL